MSSKPSVVLLGFFARGNAGDEAFLHVQHDLLKDDFHVIVPIEHKNACEGFQSWEPYNQCEIINYDDVPRVYGSDVAALHIGGGSLPFGFSGQFLMSALDAQKRTMITGVDSSVKSALGRDHIRFDIYNRLDLFSVRTTKSIFNLRKAGVGVHHGADWALGLKAIEPPAHKRGGALVTLRNFGTPDQEHIDAVNRLHAYLERQGHKVRYLPFAPDDQRFMKFFPTANADNTELCWHDPRQVKGLIGAADVVVSVGRLHTLIMSMTSQVPTLAIDPKIMVDGKHILNRKNVFFCEEVGLPFYYSVDDMIAEYGDDFNSRVKVIDFAPDYYERLKQQFDLVLKTARGDADVDKSWRAGAAAVPSFGAAAQPGATSLPKPVKGPDSPERAAAREAKREAKRLERIRAKEEEQAAKGGTSEAAERSDAA
ncbi:hypothetical protein JOD31_001454 [Methylopila capsulata]|uniref:Polysaccharide pyruvyl transferase domain-containing protein n=1 Tax=Methylopila capsulata TaxID=61654 RepID=A0A9W6IPS6_9HYPH|nr:polysaccharide pyruvyl transferase family protein [Methylopila capsulata]MBM7851229.1 hypothetical protein [Methylopila capsulata]GLK54287.1 hypothetical protein GCM10008170_03060 [Methylopila capsulata]